MRGDDMIPIIMFLVIGVVLALYFYFRSKDRQLIIEKGMSPEIVNNMFKYKWNPYIWLKVGIVVALGSLGVLIGNYLMWAFPNHYWDSELNSAIPENNPTMMVFSIFFMIGVGFVAAFFISRKMEREEEDRKQRLQQ
jgi:hypothetical protein